MAQNVLFLPPGVAAASPATPMPSGAPFNREFFEDVLPGSIKAFCQQVDCDSPIVELLTVDGTKHFVKGISGSSDSWVALHTQDEDHDHAIQVFLPYSTIFRVEIHPEKDAEERRLGFIDQIRPDGAE